MENERDSARITNLEEVDFVPDFSSSVIQANKPIQKIKIFKGTETDILQEQINDFLKDKSLVNIQCQVCARVQDIHYVIMIHYLED